MQIFGPDMHNKNNNNNGLVNASFLGSMNEKSIIQLNQTFNLLRFHLPCIAQAYICRPLNVNESL